MVAARGGGQSLPKPRGGSTARSSERSRSQIASNALAVAPSCRLGGSASSQATHWACTVVNSVTASRQRWMRLRRSVGGRMWMAGLPAVWAARWRAWRSASVIGLSPIGLRGMLHSNENPKPCRGTKDSDKIIAAVGRGHQALDSLH